MKNAQRKMKSTFAFFSDFYTGKNNAKRKMKSGDFQQGKSWLQFLNATPKMKSTSHFFLLMTCLEAQGETYKYLEGLSLRW